MKNVFQFILFMPLFASCQSEKTASKYTPQVGDIFFDKKIDDPNFKRCIPENKYAYQYYNDSKGFQYKGEKFAIIEKLTKTNLKVDDEKFNGFIIIRFLVNCDGKTGLFRVKQIDSDYHEINHDNKLKDELLGFTKSLDGWIIKEIEGKKIDYYQYINYKIVDGKVAEILP